VLARQMALLQQHGCIPERLARAMHDLRDLGNRASHVGAALPPKRVVEQTVKVYIDAKKQFELREALVAAQRRPLSRGDR